MKIHHFDCYFGLLDDFRKIQKMWDHSETKVRPSGMVSVSSQSRLRQPCGNTLHYPFVSKKLCAPNCSGGGFPGTWDILEDNCVKTSDRKLKNFVKIEIRGIQKVQNSLRPRKSNFPKLVQFLRKIYHSTRLGERFSNLFSDLKNLYAFKSYGQNTISIVDR